MRPTERAFLLAVLHRQQGQRVRDICNQVGNYKQNWYYLEKWCKRNWYSFGCTIDLGWLTPEGEAIARAVEEQG